MGSPLHLLLSPSPSSYKWLLRSPLPLEPGWWDPSRRPWCGHIRWKVPIAEGHPVMLSISFFVWACFAGAFGIDRMDDGFYLCVLCDLSNVYWSVVYLLYTFLYSSDISLPPALARVMLDIFRMTVSALRAYSSSMHGPSTWVGGKVCRMTGHQTESNNW